MGIENTATINGNTAVDASVSEAVVEKKPVAKEKQKEELPPTFRKRLRHNMKRLKPVNDGKLVLVTKPGYSGDDLRNQPVERPELNLKPVNDGSVEKLVNEGKLENGASVRLQQDTGHATQENMNIAKPGYSGDDLCNQPVEHPKLNLKPVNDGSVEKPVNDGKLENCASILLQQDTGHATQENMNIAKPGYSGDDLCNQPVERPELNLKPVNEGSVEKPVHDGKLENGASVLLQRDTGHASHENMNILKPGYSGDKIRNQPVELPKYDPLLKEPGIDENENHRVPWGTSIDGNTAVDSSVTEAVEKKLVALETKEVEEVKEKKTAMAAVPKMKKTVLSHFTYEEIIKNAIVTLNERSGSSLYAIQKFIEEKKRKELPPTFRELLPHNLKRLVASGELVKVRASFKLPTAKSSSPKAVVTSVPAMRKPEVVTEKERRAGTRLSEEEQQFYYRPSKYMIKRYEWDVPGYVVPKDGQPGNTLDEIDVTDWDDLLGCNCKNWGATEILLDY